MLAFKSVHTDLFNIEFTRFYLAAPILGTMIFMSATALGQSPTTRATTIPRTWDDAAITTLEVPLANPAASPKQITTDYYYKIPVRPIYKSYPIYAPGREPAGYNEWLKKQMPVVVWDDHDHKPTLETNEDWIKAGELAFDAPIGTPPGGFITLKDVTSPAWYERTRTPLTPDGVLPFLTYVIREKGKIELGSFACRMCHTRVMPGGAIVKGAQGNFPLSAALAIDSVYHFPVEVAQVLNRTAYAAPWLQPDPTDRQLSLSSDETLAVQRTMPPGVMARHGASLFFPVQVPDLIGVKDRHYLDRTGLQQHRSPVDIMRYAAMNQGTDFLASYAGFIPLGGPNFDKQPDPADPAVGGRYSDEQLYALALYIYSLNPPPNPNPFDSLAAHGQKVFEHEGCRGCHTPPLYTNNKLTPAAGFTPPPGASAKYDILHVSVGTDANLALNTRRGTGYYKVPSLKGVWYRSMFGHSGWCATLDDWFNPKRIDEDYVPTGFKPFDAKTYAVKGHPFGLSLSAVDRKALIAFLKTL
ncbi:MAG TPA: hypothetical protein VLI55_05540 [Bryobacteraceae bacterium]|nr:hypothetical protein [Bryobacteraceae bacterium]